MNHSFLANRRSKLGLSQGEIASKFGYSVQTVSLWETGKSTPPLPVLGQYASLLQIDFEGLLFGGEKKDNPYCDEHVFDPIAFGKNLRLLRKQNGLTQKEVADKICCSANALTRFEKGDSFPSVEQFIALAGLFQKSYDELYFCIEVEHPVIEEQPVKKRRSAFVRIVLPILISVSVLLTAAAVAMVVREIINPTTDQEATTSLTTENKPIHALFESIHD